jgi:hypothetical protein
MLFALAKPTLTSIRTSTQSPSSAETRDQVRAVRPFSTRTILLAGTPSRLSAATHRAVWSGRFQSTRPQSATPSRSSGPTRRLAGHVDITSGQPVDLGVSGRPSFQVSTLPFERVAASSSGQREVSQARVTESTIDSTVGATGTEPGYTPTTSPSPPRFEARTGRPAASHSTIVNVGPPGSAQTDGTIPRSHPSKRRRFSSPVTEPSHSTFVPCRTGTGDLVSEAAVAGDPQAPSGERRGHMRPQTTDRMIPPIEAIEHRPLDLMSANSLGKRLQIANLRSDECESFGELGDRSFGLPVGRVITVSVDDQHSHCSPAPFPPTWRTPPVTPKGPRLVLASPSRHSGRARF